MTAVSSATLELEGVVLRVERGLWSIVSGKGRIAQAVLSLIRDTAGALNLTGYDIRPDYTLAVEVIRRLGDGKLLSWTGLDDGPEKPEPPGFAL